MPHYLDRALGVYQRARGLTHCKTLHPEAAIVIASGCSVNPVFQRSGDFGFPARLFAPVSTPR